MAKLSINERLAQLISEKNMGLKSSSANDISSSVQHTAVNSVVVVKPVKTDSVEIKSRDGNSSTTSTQQSAKPAPQKAAPQQKIVTNEGNPFLHNQVVDDIAKKMLRAFVGN